MIKSVHIENFKSVVNLDLELGQFNVLIGENGCGKSNILEAIAFGGAAAADKLDYEFLGSRGIRITNPKHIFSAFEHDKNNKKLIIINFATDKAEIVCTITNNPQNPKKWINLTKIFASEIAKKIFDAVMFEQNEEKKKKILRGLNLEGIDQFPYFKQFKDSLAPLVKTSELKKKFEEIAYTQFVQDLTSNPEIANFITYSPEESKLRRFEETTQIYPLGTKGEGLFQYLKDLALDKKNRKEFIEIKQNLFFLEWFEGFKLPSKLLSNEYSLRIKDRYLHKDLQYFDQNSTNEGFLFLLFYTTLFVSKDTPSFFSIDNIDSSFNPKLCVKLIRNLSELAVKHGKQVILTTHNPAVLDGLNLKDSKQRLFVISRSNDGFTKAKRIEYKEERRMKLSEIWTKGLIGGLPENF
ncbi:MAG: ATP-binding protein [Ignavibacteria bacterium]|nr:ATP-binding protein [Ignavibacteria bacterium]